MYLFQLFFIKSDLWEKEKPPVTSNEYDMIYIEFLEYKCIVL